MQRLLDVFQCQPDELIDKLKAFREALKVGLYDFGPLFGLKDGAFYALVENRVQKIELLTNREDLVDNLVKLVHKHPEFLPGYYCPKEAAFNQMEELINTQRITNSQLHAVFVKQAIAAIKSDDKAAIERLKGIAVTTGLPYLPFLSAAHEQIL